MNPEAPKSFDLKGLLATFSLYKTELLRRKWWIIAILLLTSGIFVLDAFRTPRTYPARLTFMVNDDEGNTAGGLGAILGELGIGNNKKQHNYVKITSLALSRKILSGVIEKPISYDEVKGITGNILIDVYEFDDAWKQDSILSGFQFEPDTTKRQLIYGERNNIATDKLARFLRGNPDKGDPGVLEVGFDEESTILWLSASTIDPELSIALANNFYEELSEFYIQKSIERQLITYNEVKHKVDSLHRALEGAEAALAEFRDQTNAVILFQNSLPKLRLSRKVEMLSIMYAEAVKNMETSDFLLKVSTPYFQVIDRPIGPLKMKGKSKRKALLYGLLLGSFIGVGFFSLKLWWKLQLQTPVESSATGE